MITSRDFLFKFCCQESIKFRVVFSVSHSLWVLLFSDWRCKAPKFVPNSTLFQISNWKTIAWLESYPASIPVSLTCFHIRALGYNKCLTTGYLISQIKDTTSYLVRVSCNFFEEPRHHNCSITGHVIAGWHVKCQKHVPWREKHSLWYSKPFVSFF